MSTKKMLIKRKYTKRKRTYEHRLQSGGGGQVEVEEGILGINGDRK